MKKGLALFLASALIFVAITGCVERGNRREDLSLENVKLAFIHAGDPADIGYTYRQHRGTLDMMEKLGIPESRVMTFLNIPPGDAFDNAILEAIDWGADMIFGTSFAFGPQMLEAAEAYTNIHFFHASGNLAVDADLANFHNYFGAISEARYLSGVAAGLRTETDVLGFVAAFPNAEVISGYTAFYLGALSVNPDVTMYVTYTNAWNDSTVEAHAAQSLIDRGADVIGQHTDSTAPQTIAESNGVWSVGYNIDTTYAPQNAILVSAMFDWSVYLVFAVQEMVEGRDVPTDFIAGLADGMVLISPTNPATVAAGTDEAIEAAKTRILNGWDVFTGPIYGSDGSQILADGEQWIEMLSAPSWSHIVQGITIVD